MANIGFIGIGNMATAMVRGLASSGLYENKQLFLYNRSKEKAVQLADELDLVAVEQAKEIAENCQIIIFGVKPHVLPGLLAEMKADLTKEHLLISVAAGLTLATLAKSLTPQHKLVRVMPNTPALVGAGMSAVCGNSTVTPEEIASVLAIFNSFGKAQEVPEDLMDAVVGVSGSAPAYVFLFIEALADGAVRAGMPRQLAYEFAAQTVFGSAKMVLDTKEHPGVLKDQVCSPKGTTIAAVQSLEETGFRGSVIQAVQTAAEKNHQLAEKTE